MKFSIITPTHKRPQELKRCIDSLLVQKYKNWEMIIINDSPDFDYKDVEDYIFEVNKVENNKIIYIKNKINLGKNYSCNQGLKSISSDSDYIILLDDDDWLSLESLSQINKELNSGKEFWLVANRFDATKGAKLTINNTEGCKKQINYMLDYMLLKRFKGDATHIISTKIKNFKNMHFCDKIKNGEEWFYFNQIQKEVPNFSYVDLDSTLSEGYNKKGITKTYTSKIEKLKNTQILFFESLKSESIDFYTILYFLARICAIILK